MLVTKKKKKKNHDTILTSLMMFNCPFTNEVQNLFDAKYKSHLNI